VDEEILRSHPSSEGALKQKWEEVLKNLKRDRFRAQGLFAVFDKALGSEQCFGGKVQEQKLRRVM
jgi:hypothetical protein